jgi:hypothetical protein
MPVVVSNAVRAGAIAIVVGLVGYAVWIASRPEASPTTAPATSRKAAAEAKGDRKGPDGDDGERPVARRAPPSKEAIAARTTPAPPPPPEDIDFEKTLDGLEAFVVEIEGFKERGIKIPQPEWVERYRRGSELVDTLMRAPEAVDPRAKKEVQDLNMRFRAVIQDLLAPP